MAFSQTDLDKIDAAIASNTKSVQFADGQRIEYRSVDEMMTARRHIAAIVAQSSSGGRATLYPTMTLSRER